MYCLHCGATMDPGTRFCPGCGAARGSKPDSNFDREAEARAAKPSEPIKIVVEQAPAPQVVLQNQIVNHAPMPHSVIYHDQVVSSARLAATEIKSFTKSAWICVALYALLYVPGLVMNFIYWRQAVSYEKTTGVRAKGTGCLFWLLLVVGVGLPVLALIGSATGNTTTP
jgi:hypothetical protein